MKKPRLPIISLALIFVSVAQILPATADTSVDAPKGAMVMFLTQTGENVAGPALHIAQRMQAEGRKTTVVLLGDAGRLGVKGAKTKKSAIGDKSLQAALKGAIEAGVSVFITPPTLGLIGATPDDLMEGVSLPIDHAGLHDHMFEIATKLVVF